MYMFHQKSIFRLLKSKKCIKRFPFNTERCVAAVRKESNVHPTTTASFPVVWFCTAILDSHTLLGHKVRQVCTLYSALRKDRRHQTNTDSLDSFYIFRFPKRRLLEDAHDAIALLMMLTKGKMPSLCFTVKATE